MKCKALTKSGTPCRNEALEGSEYCFIPAHQALAERQEQIVEELKILVPEQPEPATVQCGHTNLHATMTREDGSKYHLTCDLEKGHKGLHSARYHAIEKRNGSLVRDEMVSTTWSNMAGTPPEDILPDMRTLKITDPRHPDYNDLISKLSR